MFLLALSGTSVVSKLLSLERAEWAKIDSSTAHSWSGTKTEAVMRLHGDIDTLRLYITGTGDTEA